MVPSEAWESKSEPKVHRARLGLEFVPGKRQ